MEAAPASAPVRTSEEHFTGLLSLPREETRERAATGNQIEKLKAAKDGLSVRNDLEKLASQGYETAYKESAEDIDHRLKWLGVFNRPKRTPGKFMMRLKIPNGILTSDQMRYLASVIANYDPSVGVADITTRQNIQLRGLVLEDLPAILKGLRQVGLTSVQSGMDNVRNMVGSPIAGIDPLEMFDTRELCRQVQDMITDCGEGNTEFTNLPRKFNISISGGRDDFAHTDINDIGFRPVEKDGVMGFNVVLGGYMGSIRVIHSVPMDAWVPPEQVVVFCRAVLEVFRDNGSRKNRNKARMMYLIEEWSMDKFRAAIETQMGATLARAQTMDTSTPWKHRDLLGVHDQKQAGLHWVGLNVPVGRLLPADMIEFARVADTYGTGELRLTVDQNVLVPHVPTDRVTSLLADPIVEKFAPAPGPLTSGLVSCTGAQFCGFALVETKNRALALARELEQELHIPGPVRMHWTGCSNTCAQAQMAEIGIMGTASAKKDGKKVEGVKIFVDGEIGEHANLGTVYKDGIPCDDAKEVLADLLVTKFGATRRS